MASVNETVENYIATHGDVAQTRSDVLYLLLGTLGNGWGWKDGQFIDMDDDPRKRTTLLTVEREEAWHRARWEAEEMPEWMMESLWETWLPKIQRAAQVASEAKERASIVGFGEVITQAMVEQRYFQEQTPGMTKKGSPFLNVPADADQDWKDAADEIRTLLLENDIRIN